MAIAPMPVSMLIAMPSWRKQEPILGNVFGTAVIFGTAIALILRESVELEHLTASCLEAGLTDCFPTPSAFSRFAIYAFLGLVEVITLFLVSITVERRIRDRDSAPEWRSWGRR